jgi:UDP-glucose-4-epimerase GalE
MATSFLVKKHACECPWRRVSVTETSQADTKVSHVLVTGGAGYIGSHACKALARAGFVPIAYDNLSAGHEWAVKWGPLERGDIGDATRVRAVVDRYRPIAVMHFAAHAYVGESVRQPLKYYQNNFAGAAELLRAVVEAAAVPFVFSSTCATYGIPDAVPISEQHRQRPINPYGWSKLFVEQMLRDLSVSHGLPWAALRYFNAAGADPDGEIGEDHDPETHLIPLVLKAALDGGEVQVFGDDYDTPDGTCIRDYVHVSDLADAHVLALRRLLHSGTCGAFNLANAKGYSVKEVVRSAQKVCGHQIRARSVARRPGDPAVLIGDSREARAVLSWQPTRSELELQIADAWRWIGRDRKQTRLEINTSLAVGDV